jgi:hypothetical protein
MAMSRAMGSRSLTRRSPMRMSPELTVSRPATMRRSVDLPHPEGPTSTHNPPSGTVKETPFTASKPPA